MKKKPQENPKSHKNNQQAEKKKNMILFLTPMLSFKADSYVYSREQKFG